MFTSPTVTWRTNTSPVLPFNLLNVRERVNGPSALLHVYVRTLDGIMSQHTTLSFRELFPSESVESFVVQIHTRCMIGFGLLRQLSSFVSFRESCVAGSLFAVPWWLALAINQLPESCVGGSLVAVCWWKQLENVWHGCKTIPFTWYIRTRFSFGGRAKRLMILHFAPPRVCPYPNGRARSYTAM